MGNFEIIIFAVCIVLVIAGIAWGHIVTTKAQQKNLQESQNKQKK